MSSYYYSLVARRDFGDLIAEEKLSRLNVVSETKNKFPKLPLDGNLVLALWSNFPQKNPQLPQLLICKDGTQDDWSAWITTFAAKIRPFSAYMRLMPYSDFQWIEKKAPAPELGVLTWPAAGLILGEVLGASGLPDKSLDTLPATAFTSTLSYVMLRAAAMYPHFKEWTSLVRSWESTREITNQRVRSVETSDIARVCAIIIEAMGLKGVSNIFTTRDKEVREACQHLIKSPNNAPPIFSISSIFDDTEHMMHGSREDRVVAFEKFLKIIANNPTIEPEIMSFMVGYLASRIAPGTIRHSSVLSQVTSRYPTAMLWYGFCSGFADTTNSFQRWSVDFPLSARRVTRELLRAESVLSIPSCDIGYLELLALSRTSEDPLEGLIKTTQGSANVELLPDVCTSVNIVSKSPIDSKSRESREREILATMGEQIERLCETYKNLLISETPSKKAEQRSLFSSGRKKK